MVDLKVWKVAQIAERKQHKLDLVSAIEHYRKSYAQYFEYLQIDPNINGRIICEIGPADVPGLYYCTDTSNSFVVEPMPSEILPRLGINIIKKRAELLDFSQVDEVWLMNVLQHVVDPDKIVQEAKKARVVRWFEPVNQGTDACHLHNLTHEMFEKWFGISNRYIAKPKTEAFHLASCSYGIYDNI